MVRHVSRHRELAAQGGGNRIEGMQRDQTACNGTRRHATGRNRHDPDAAQGERTGAGILNDPGGGRAVTVVAIRSVASERERDVQTDLVDRAQRGDREAFSVLAGGAVDRLYGIARNILRDAELAEDATQEALVRAWRDLPALRDAERFDAWLYRLLVNACADVGRRRRQLRAEITVVSTEPSELDRATELADRDELERGLRRLTDAQRGVLVMSFYLGLSHGELAEILGIPVGTAKSRLHYAIEALRAALAADARSATDRREERTA
jgi:RNA polymerase sigma-70 factor, ECF subfamily